MSEIRTSRVAVQVADGTEMSVYVARPEGNDRAPAILVFQEAFGVNDHIRDIAERFARDGWLALAPELFHRTAPGFEGSYDDFPSVRKHVEALTVPGLEADIRAAHELARNDPGSDGRVASIGFCMGGRTSYLANSIVPLVAAVSFYGGGIAPALLDRAADQKSPLLMFWGGLDKHIGAADRAAVREALETAGKPFIEVLVSYADHGFNCDRRASYQPDAARDAWVLATSFLRGWLDKTKTM